MPPVCKRVVRNKKKKKATKLHELCKGFSYSQGHALAPYTMHLTKGVIFDGRKLKAYIKKHSQSVNKSDIIATSSTSFKEHCKNITTDLSVSLPAITDAVSASTNIDFSFDSTNKEKTSFVSASHRKLVSTVALPDKNQTEQLRKLCQEDFLDMLDEIENKIDARNLLAHYGPCFVQQADYGGLYTMTTTSTETSSSAVTKIKADLMMEIKNVVNAKSNSSYKNSTSAENTAQFKKEIIIGGDNSVFLEKGLSAWHKTVEESPALVKVVMAEIFCLTADDNIKNLLRQELANLQFYATYSTGSKQVFMAKNHIGYHLMRGTCESKKRAIEKYYNWMLRNANPIQAASRAMSGYTAEQQGYKDAALDSMKRILYAVNTKGKTMSCSQMSLFLYDEYNRTNEPRIKPMLKQFSTDFAEDLPFTFLLGKNVAFQSAKYFRHLKIDHDNVVGTNDASETPAALVGETYDSDFTLEVVSSMKSNPRCFLYNEIYDVYLGVRENGEVYTESIREPKETSKDFVFSIEFGNRTVDNSVLIRCGAHNKILSMNEKIVSTIDCEDGKYSKQGVQNELFYVYLREYIM